MKNDANGYELRNQFFKGSSQAKDITTLGNKGQKLAVFEGFFDFLSYQTIYKNWACLNEDDLILNSLSFLKRVKPFLAQYKGVHLLLARDTKGQNSTHDLLSLGSHIHDESHLYQHYKDLNEWLMKFGLPENQSLQKSPIPSQEATESDFKQPK